MSYTITQQPATKILSANNPALFVLSSSNVGQTDFKYTAEVFFGLPNPTFMKTYPDPTLKFGVFDISDITRNITSYDYIVSGTDAYNSILGSGFTPCLNSSYNAEIFFGEEYITSDGTFSQSIALTSSSLLTFINSALSYQDQISVDMESYYLDGTSPKKCLTKKNNNSFLAYSNLNQWLYMYNASSSLTAANVYTYDVNGNNLGIYTVPNPFVAFPGVFAFGSGYGQLSALSSSIYSVSAGSYPMMTSQVSYYIINIGAIILTTSASFLVDGDGEFLIDSDDADLIAEGSLIGSGSSNSELYQYHVTPNCGKFAPGSVALEWLNPLGGFDSFLFTKMNETSVTKTQSQFKRIAGQLNSNGTYSYNSANPQNVSYYTELQDTTVLNSDWLDDSNILFLKDMFASPVVFMRTPSGKSFPVCFKDDSYRISKKVNQKLYQLTVNVDTGFTNFTQRQ